MTKRDRAWHPAQFRKAEHLFQIRQIEKGILPGEEKHELEIEKTWDYSEEIVIRIAEGATEAEHYLNPLDPELVRNIGLKVIEKAYGFTNGTNPKKYANSFTLDEVKALGNKLYRDADQLAGQLEGKTDIGSIPHGTTFLTFMGWVTKALESHKTQASPGFGPIPSSWVYTALKQALIQELRYYGRAKRQGIEIGYDDVPGMNDLVYSGEDESDNCP